MTKNITTMSVGYTTYMLPESMTAREIQTLAGLVATLRKVDYVLSNSGDYKAFHYLGDYCEVKLGTAQATGTSREQAEAARAAYDQEQQAAKAEAAAE